MQTYTSLVLSVCLSVGLTTNALAANSTSNQLSDILSNSQLLSARTGLNGPYEPDKGGGRRDFQDTTHSNPVNVEL
ncbi:MAG: heterocyst-inhibiting protein PatX [Planktothrix sp.]